MHVWARGRHTCTHVPVLTCAQIMLNCAVARQRKLQKPIVCSIKQSATDGFHIPTGYEHHNALTTVVKIKAVLLITDMYILVSINSNATGILLLPFVKLINITSFNTSHKESHVVNVTHTRVTICNYWLHMHIEGRYIMVTSKLTCFTQCGHFPPVLLSQCTPHWISTLPTLLCSHMTAPGHHNRCWILHGKCHQCLRNLHRRNWFGIYNLEHQCTVCELLSLSQWC